MYCIYKITNLINGKTYIGQHKYKKLNDNYMGSGKLIKLAIKKHSIENFKKEILEFNIPTVELANDWEQMYILFERAKGKSEYNIAAGGGGTVGVTSWNKGKSSWIKGKHLSDETKKKIGEANKVALKGHIPWNKGKKGHPAWNKGISCSDETKRKISESKKGISMPEEQRKKRTGREPWNKGKKMSEEAKKNMSKAKKGCHVSWEGKPMSEERKKRLSELHKGRKWFNNGEISVMCYECPDGFVSGRIYQRKKEDK